VTAFITNGKSDRVRILFVDHLPKFQLVRQTPGRSQWREQTKGGQRVFEMSTGFKTTWAPLLKRAAITKFRWHDLRHHFASRLVQAGVPLNTVRDLLGHGSVAMSLRYAHLAPDQRREAVAKLNEKHPALTMRLR
jgi:integrase